MFSKAPAENYELDPLTVFGEKRGLALGDEIVDYITERSGFCVSGLGWSISVDVVFDEDEDDDDNDNDNDNDED